MRAVIALLALLATPSLYAASCPDWLDVDKRRLHDKEQVNLCQLTAGRPALIVNTASNCGYTPQFKQLEQLHKTYGDQLVIIGFPSDDFFQEEDEEAKTAEVCYRNYGVSFTMLAPISVRGSDADPIFKALADQGGSPKWNFYKYLVDGNGKLVDYWAPTTRPDDEEIVSEINKLVSGS
ncbi:glutathione peroxidase [Ferrimonas futtsuensis]|uniref:glutathione peroxidase n=1 Tax=Ferrimonas futtsuensis TaxID=364764 RepID=UPI000422690A|nr:glutathione peroxidase [Ferrimonas futtsuensis]